MSDHDSIYSHLRQSFSQVTSSGSGWASQTIHFSENELTLRISDHDFLRKWVLYHRSWVCARQTTMTNIGDASLPRTLHKEQEQGWSTVVALLESAVLSGEIIPRISAGNERFYLDNFNRFWVLWSCLVGLLSSINRCWLVSSVKLSLLAGTDIDRKTAAKEKLPELDMCPPSNLLCIAMNITGNMKSNTRREKNGDQEMHWISEYSGAICPFIIQRFNPLHLIWEFIGLKAYLR